MIRRRGWLALYVLGMGLCGCEASDAPRLVITADWLNQSLTLLDYDRLTDGASDGEACIVRRIDLSDWEPGPIELEITPDGKTAVVAVGPAFFDNEFISTLVGSPEIPSGGTLLIVDLDSGDATEVATEDIPLGIAISADGAIAYTANYGTADAPGDTLSVIDIVRKVVVKELTVGDRPEQVALSPDGTLGVVNIAGGGGGIRVFEIADVEGTLSPLVPTGNDPSDVTFLDDETRVVVANSLSFDVTLVDTSDPRSPSVIDRFAYAAGAPYGVTYMPSRGQILAPAGTGSYLVTIARNGDLLVPSEPAAIPGGPFVLTAAVDRTDSFAFVAHAADKKLSVIDLESGAVRAISWLDGAGPSYVAVQP